MRPQPAIGVYIDGLGVKRTGTSLPANVALGSAIGSPTDVVPLVAFHAYPQWVGLFQFPATVEPAADGRGVTIRAPQRAIVMFVVIFGPVLIGGGVLNQIFHDPELPRLPVSTAAVGGVIVVLLLFVVLTILQRRRFVRVGEEGLEVSDGIRRVKLAWTTMAAKLLPLCQSSEDL